VFGLAALITSAIQVRAKVDDWVWAGRMTAEGARMVDEALAPACGDGHVVFLTSPVSVRGVYTHFYYETFELPRGCQPGTFQVLARAVRSDPAVEATWAAPGVIRVVATGARLVFSGDLRHFDTRVRNGTTRLATPLGPVEISADGSRYVLSLALAPAVNPEAVHFFFFSRGRLHRLEHPPVGP
jgi:hypothetical protein